MIEEIVKRRGVWTDTPYSESKSASYERRKRREDPEYRKARIEYQRKWLAARPGYRKAHPGKPRKRNKAYRRSQYSKHKARLCNDPLYVIRARLRARLGTAIKVNLGESKIRKAYNTQTLLGCSWHEFRTYLESKWLPGMSWDNRSEWHIDHKIPVASFNLIDPEEQKRCFHFTNLQPLWKLDNLKKASKVDV